jgi:RND family efflux transporter MFP subunit
MTWKRLLGFVLVLALVIGLVTVRARRASERQNAPRLAPQPVTIEVSPLRSGSVQSRQSFLGEVTAGNEAPLSARIVSQVLSVTVREGDAVRRGQLLVDLDPRELDDAAASLEAGVIAAREAQVAGQVAYDAQRQSTARDKTLADAEAISREEFERSHTALAGARARLEAVQAQVVAAQKALQSAATRRGYAAIRAPFDGVVSRRDVNPGDMATPGKPLVTIVRTGGLRVRVKIPADRLAGLAAGHLVAVRGPAGDVALPIARVHPALDASHLATIEVDAPDTLHLLIGATPVVDVMRPSGEGLITPVRALVETQAGAYVFLVAGDRVRRLQVHVLGRGAEGVAIRGEVKAGDLVAVGTPSRLAMLTGDTRIRVVSTSASSR